MSGRATAKYRVHMHVTLSSLQKVQTYLKKVREGGGVVSARIAVAAAKGILLTCDRSLLAEYGGHIELKGDWTYSLLCRMKFVQRKSRQPRVNTLLQNSVN